MGNSGFSPNIRCPYCGKVAPSEISGFGREGYNARSKGCKFCFKQYTVELVVSVAKPEETVPDGRLAEIKSRIKWIRSERRKTTEQRLNDLQTMSAFYRQEQLEIMMLAMDAEGHA